MASPHILIIDDERGNRASIRMILHSAGLDAAEAAGGQEALAEAARRRPDLILCDLRLPGLDGIQTVEALRRDPHLRAVPVIFMSGLPAEERLRAGGALGAAGFLLKPFSIGELLSQIWKGLGEASAGRLDQG